jgi:hypothetical protein
MSLDREASPGTPGAGYQDTNDRDIVAKQDGDVGDSSAFSDGTIDVEAVKVLPGTGGPDDTGDEAVPDDYDPMGHANPSKASDGGGQSAAVEPKTLDPDGTPIENPSG